MAKSEAEELEAPEALAERLGHAFERTERIREALVHRSYVNEHRTAGPHNERLEFLGDAVLDLVVAETLMERLPDAAEGELTQRRAALVNERNLAGTARELGLGRALRLGRGEEQNNGRDRSSILADAFEAVVGAVYLDGGYAAARRVALTWLGVAVEEVVSRREIGDVKTALQERLHAAGAPPPDYRVVAVEGPDHDPSFEVEAASGDRPLGRGRGRSKKDAEKAAARRSLGLVAGGGEAADAGTAGRETE